MHSHTKGRLASDLEMGLGLLAVRYTWWEVEPNGVVGDYPDVIDASAHLGSLVAFIDRGNC